MVTRPEIAVLVFHSNQIYQATNTQKRFKQPSLGFFPRVTYRGNWVSAVAGSPARPMRPTACRTASRQGRADGPPSRRCWQARWSKWSSTSPGRCSATCTARKTGCCSRPDCCHDCYLSSSSVGFRASAAAPSAVAASSSALRTRPAAAPPRGGRGTAASQLAPHTVAAILYKHIARSLSLFSSLFFLFAEI